MSDNESLLGLCVGVVDGETGGERCEGQGVEGGCGLVMPARMGGVLVECFVHCGQSYDMICICVSKVKLKMEFEMERIGRLED
jgi:hypothetical protein